MSKRTRWILAYLIALLPIIIIFGTMGVVQYRSEKSFYDRSAKVMAFVVKSGHYGRFSHTVVTYEVDDVEYRFVTLDGYTEKVGEYIEIAYDTKNPYDASMVTEPRPLFYVFMYSGMIIIFCFMIVLAMPKYKSHV